MVVCFQKSLLSLVKCCTGGCKIYRGGNQTHLSHCKRFLIYILNMCGRACAYDCCRVVRLEKSYGDSSVKAELAEMMRITGMCCACPC